MAGAQSGGAEWPCGVCGRDVGDPREALECRRHFIRDFAALRERVERAEEEVRALRAERAPERRRYVLTVHFDPVDEEGGQAEFTFDLDRAGEILAPGAASVSAVRRAVLVGTLLSGGSWRATLEIKE